MGTAASAPIKEPSNFGKVYASEGEKTRPGYYFGKGGVVYKGQSIIPLPGETGFQKLKYGYLRSNKRVFFKGQPLIGANPDTFTVITRNNVHSLCKNQERNQEFKRLNTVLGTDFVGNTRRVYLGTNLIYTE